MVISWQGQLQKNQSKNSQTLVLELVLKVCLKYTYQKFSLRKKPESWHLQEILHSYAQNGAFSHPYFYGKLTLFFWDSRSN